MLKSSTLRELKTAKRLVYNTAFSASIETVDLDEFGENDVLIQTINSGISRGTEGLVYSGMVPESEYDRMRCPNQNGSFAFPINYGYACTGKVIAVGANVVQYNKNDLVFALHPHQSHFVVDQQWVVPLPVHTTAERGVLTANLETALNAFWDAEIQNNDRCAVIGAGVVGLLTAYMVAQSTQSEVTIIDINKNRHSVSEYLGLRFKTPDLLSNSEFECIFNTTASSRGLQTALDHAAFEGRIIEMSWYGTRSVNVNLGGAFHARRLAIMSSQVGHVARSRRGKLSHRQRMENAMEYLADPRLDALLTPRLTLDALPQKLDEIFKKDTETLCPLIDYISGDLSV